MEPTTRELIERSLALWQRFPVEAHPRPIVLSGVAVLSSGGFDSVEAKESFSAGMIETEVELEPGVLERLTEQAGAPNMSGLSPLRIVRAVPARRRFMTDRGMRRLPAWDLQLTHTRGVWTVMSPTVRTWWPQGWDTSLFHETQRPPSFVDPTGRKLTYAFFGGPPHDTSYRVGEILETDRAVHVAVVRDRKEPGRQAIPAAGAFRSIDVALDRPLGARVLIDHLGNPLPVRS